MCIEAYAAGLLDGEGCIHISKPSNARKRHHLAVIFQMNDRESLDLLAHIFGGNVQPHSTPHTSRRISYIWQLQGELCHNFLLAIRPHVVVKDKQVEIALQWPTFGGWGSGGRVGQLPQEIQDKRELLRLQLAATRGK